MRQAIDHDLIDTDASELSCWGRYHDVVIQLSADYSCQ